MKKNKHWANEWTEIEDLGDGQYQAGISVSHQVFFDKRDSYKPKKHKLTDKRPHHVTIQSALCCAEIHPHYAIYFDVDYEKVNVDKEKWVLQREEKKNKWKDVRLLNPVMEVIETENGITVIIDYETAYGNLNIKYIQKDTSALKHEITFISTADNTETFKVIQKWSGIKATKCNGKGGTSHEIKCPLKASHLVFQDSQGGIVVEEDHSPMLFEKGGRKKEKRLKLPIKVKGGLKGMDTEFIYEKWILKNGEKLFIDPATATVSANHGYAGSQKYNASTQTMGIRTYNFLEIDGSQHFCGVSAGGTEVSRGFAEWDLSSVPKGITVSNAKLQYEGQSFEQEGHIVPLYLRPSTTSSNSILFWSIRPQGTSEDAAIYGGGPGTDLFPKLGANKEISLNARACREIQARIAAGWFSAGFTVVEECDDEESVIKTAFGGATPVPTLVITYGWDPTGGIGWLSHHSGNVISASSHTSQTSKIQTVIGVVNEHTNLRLLEENSNYGMDAWIWRDTDDVIVEQASWNSYMTTYISTGTVLTELLIKQNYVGGRTDKTIAGLYLYENGVDIAGGDDAIMDYSDSTAETDWFMMQSYADTFYFYRIPIGLYRFEGDTSHTLTLTIKNTHGTESMLISAARLCGFEL